MPAIISLTIPRFELFKAVSLTVIVLLLTCAAAAQPIKPALSDLVHYGDLIDLDVAGGFEFDWRGTLNPEGFLDGVNTYGEPVYGLCRSEKDIAADVVRAYSRLLRDPVVTIKIIDRSNRAVATLDGAVRLPQRFQLKRPASLLELIVMSGGLTDEAGGSIQIFRPRNLSCERSATDVVASNVTAAALVSGNRPQIENITIVDLLTGKESANPIIRSGDLVTVMRSTPIYVIGGVNNPRNIASRTGITLSRAIASAGGLAKEANGQAVSVFRRDGADTRVIEFDLAKISDGSVPDPELRAFDIVEVSQKGRPKRTLPPVISNLRSERPNSLPLRIVD